MEADIAVQCHLLADRKPRNSKELVLPNRILRNHFGALMDIRSFYTKKMAAVYNMLVRLLTVTRRQ